MKIGSAFPGTYLKQEDVGPQGLLLTIANVKMEEVDKDEQKPVMYFHEVQQGMVLNKTNGNLLTQILQTDETSYWIGRQVVVYVDPTISMGGKIVGGLRVRAAQQAAPQQPQQPAGYPAPTAQPMAPPPAPGAVQQPPPVPQPGQAAPQPAPAPQGYPQPGQAPQQPPQPGETPWGQ